MHDSNLLPYSFASLFVIVIGDGGNSFLAKLNVAYACDVFVTSSLTMCCACMALCLSVCLCE